MQQEQVREKGVLLLAAVQEKVKERKKKEVRQCWLSH